MVCAVLLFFLFVIGFMSREVYFATTNAGKVATIAKKLSDFGVVVKHEAIELPESRSYDVAEIACQKAVAAFKRLERPCFAVDAGFHIRSLNGFPKTFVNFALQHIGLDGFLKLVDGKERHCEFRVCIAFCDSDAAEPIVFERIVPGNIALKPRGIERERNWSSLSFIFIPDNESKTLAEMTDAEFEEWRIKSDVDRNIRDFAKYLLSK